MIAQKIFQIKHLKNWVLYILYLIRILQGATEQGNQWGSFHRASGIINTKLVKIAYLNVTDVKNNKWKPQNLVDWLLGGNLHIVITQSSKSIFSGFRKIYWAVFCQFCFLHSNFFFHINIIQVIIFHQPGTPLLSKNNHSMDQKLLQLWTGCFF